MEDLQKWRKYLGQTTGLNDPYSHFLHLLNKREVHQTCRIKEERFANYCNERLIERMLQV